MSREDVHAAISEWLEDGEIAVSWMLVIDVAGSDETRYIAHRGGGGIDGNEVPMVWTALGMLKAALIVAEEQLRDCTEDAEDDDEE